MKQNEREEHKMTNEERAVAVAADGEWAVYGHRDEDDTVVATQAAHLTSSSHPDEYFIEAQVPKPVKNATIQAHVEDVS